jgi:hypothetical protein
MRCDKQHHNVCIIGMIDTRDYSGKIQFALLVFGNDNGLNIALIENFSLN